MLGFMQKAVSKIFVSIAIVSSSLVAHASTEVVVRPDVALTNVKLTEGDTFLSFIGGDVIDVKSELVSACPRRRPHDIEPVCLGLISETKIKVLFKLGGCLDHLGPVSINVVQNESSDVSAIVVSAMRIANKRSLVAFCAAMPTQVVEFVVKGVELDADQVKSKIVFSGK